jgi:YesN/AraC family two-component response regulator
MYRLLIADDEAVILKGLSEHMDWGALGCTVCGAARDGREAVEMFERDTPDVVITDIKMPRMNGLDVARYVHENAPQTRVVILTGFAEFEYARQAIAYGVAEYVLKPISKDRLSEAVGKQIAALEKASVSSAYAERLYDIEKQINARDYEAGRRSVSSLVNSLNALVRRRKRFSPLIEDTLGFIHAHYADDLSLESLAARVPVNPSHLSRTFKKETGGNLVEYIARTRIEKAKELLTYTDMPAYGVAEAVG